MIILADLEQASREELLALVAALRAQVEAQAALIAEQAVRMAELERQVGRSSLFTRRCPRRGKPWTSRRTRRAPKAGVRRVRAGAAGTTLAQVDHPTKTVKHYPAACQRCTAGLDSAVVVGEPVRRQVFDVPEPVVEVTEHQMFSLCCAGCGALTRAPAPVEATAPACYGPQVTAIAAYLSAQHHLPVDRVAEVLADLLGIAVSPGWAVAALRRAEDAIAAAPVAHFDESVTRVAGANH